MRALTEAMLRSAKLAEGDAYDVAPGTFVTPEARHYAACRGIILRQAAWEEMPRGAGPGGGESPYVDAETGAEYREKPEEMTHLAGNRLVKKSHPRIALRGRLDLLQAEIIAVQALACERGDGALVERLGEVLAAARAMLAAEVREEPLAPLVLFGLDEAGLRAASHGVGTISGTRHPVPDYRMGETAARLNLLRARVREAELAAVRAFDGEREDIVRALNRLSSAVYNLYCREDKRHG